jgi:hypothetical protein
MGDEHKAKRLEIAHVLFMDIVGYSKLLVKQQSELLRMLSYGALKLFPFWDPLRGDPRFEKIVTELAPRGK